MPLKTSTSSSASRRILVILALTLFIVALILVIVSSVLPGSGKKGTLSLGGSSYAEGYKAAREQAFTLGMQKMVATSISGTIESISGDTVLIKTTLFLDKRVDGVGPERTIKTSGAKILKVSMKDLETIRKEQQAFSAALKDYKTGDSVVQPPSPYDSKEIKVSDLKVGDMITVTGNGKDDLTLVDPINATSIQTQEISLPAAPSSALTTSSTTK